jgi:hypothetical protein
MQSTVCEHVKTLTNVRWRPSLLRDGRRHGGELRAWRRGPRRLAGLHALRRITSPWIAAERPMGRLTHAATSDRHLYHLRMAQGWLLLSGGAFLGCLVAISRLQQMSARGDRTSTAGAGA